MLEEFYKYISEELECEVDDLKSGEIQIVLNKKKEPYLKILSIHETTIVSVSSHLYNVAKKELSEKSRDELFESPLIYGQTIHYVPQNVEQKNIPIREDYTFCLVTGKEVYKLQGISGIENTIEFDENGNTDTVVAMYVKNKEGIIACAGASYVNKTLREVGVDVKKEYRNQGLATLLVGRLTQSILDRNEIPFYSASSTNLLSQQVAIKCGYIPLWTDTYSLR